VNPTRGSSAAPERVWPLSELARDFSARLEEDWPPRWVAGEVSGLKLHAASGHRYFTLKDAQAQFSAVLWRARAAQNPVLPADGMQVEALVQLVFYPPGGRLQLDVLRLRAAGRGDLMAAFLALRERLAREGLFDAARKRPLPPFPRRVGLLTAEGGAALKDLLAVLRRRMPGLRCFLLPVPVQGPQCGPALAAGLRRLAAWPGLELDLIILGRGGGSFEDLFGFNDEGLVRAIAACPVPVVSAVGHEIDTTLSDLAADLRAPTPSAAAELAVPDAALLERRLDALGEGLRAALRRRLEGEAARLRLLASHRALAEPLRRLDHARQRLDELRERLPAALGRQHAEISARLLGWPRRLSTLARRVLEERARRVAELSARLERLEAGRLKERCLRLGFALVWRGGEPLAGAAGLAAGDEIRLEFHDGAAAARVTGIEERPS
jgi:exodeoxyribonuclease VII large subunit